MNRALGTVAALLVGCVLLPTVAEYATEAVPVLISFLVFLGFLRLLLPGKGRK